MQFGVVSYNIHKCIGGIDRRYNPERVRDAIAPCNPDFVLLQEVDDGAARTQRHRQVDLLGEMLGLRHRAFYPNVPVSGGGHYGNAILSRYPLTHAENIDVSIPWTKRRSVLHVRARVRRHGGHARTVHVFGAHLGLAQILRHRQIRRFFESPSFKGLHPRTPAVLGGDFNDVWGSLRRKLLPEAGFRGRKQAVWTFPAWAPLRPLDSIYVRGDAELLDLVRTEAHPARWASDHRPIFGVVEVR